MTLSETLIAALGQNVVTRDAQRNRQAVKNILYRHFKKGYRRAAARHRNNLHDAIATIISMAGLGPVAVGSIRTKEYLKIYIASNGTRLDGIKGSLEEIWDLLRYIQRNQEICSKSPLDVSDDPTGPHSQLRALIYSNSLERIKMLFCKGQSLQFSRVFEEVLRPETKYVTKDPEPDSSCYIIPEELEIVELLHRACDFGFLFKEIPSHIDWFNRLRLEFSIVDLLQSTLRLLYPILQFMRSMMHGSLLYRLDFILQDITQSPKRAFCRFWDELLALEGSIVELVNLTTSPRNGYILALNCTIEIVEHPEVSLRYNFRRDVDFRKLFGGNETPLNDFLSACCKRSDSPTHMNSTVTPHCECVLLAYFLNEGIDAYSYIAVSERSCRGCSFYFEAYKEVASKHNLKPFYVTTRSLRVQRPWVKPRLMDVAVEGLIESTLVSLAKESLFEILEEVEGKSPSESEDVPDTTQDLSESEEQMKCDEGVSGVCCQLES